MTENMTTNTTAPTATESTAKEQKVSWKSKRYWLGLLAFCVARLLYVTLRVKIQRHAHYTKNVPYLFAFWHGKQFLPVFELIRRHHTDGAVLVSPSKDGDILTVWLQKMGYKVMRGSSRHHNIKALAMMMRKLKQGLSIGFGVDGPIGPIHKVKPGMTHMAQRTHTPIVPMGIAFSRKWVFEKAWDRYELPKPFSTAVCYFAEPMEVAEEADLDHSNLLLEERLKAAEVFAAELVRRNPP